MTLVHAEGFESTSLWARKNYLRGGSTSPTVATGRNGNALALDADSSPSFLTYFLPAAHRHATVITGFAYKADASAFPMAVDEPMIRFYGDAGAVLHGVIDFDSLNGTNLTAWRNTGTALGTSSGVSFSSGIWYYIEVKYVLHDSTGSIVIKANGTTILNLTSIDTKFGGSGSTIDAIGFSGRGSAVAGNAYVDDWYVLNGAGGQYDDFLGDITVETLRPNGNGNESDFVGSDSNSTDNYLLVDEATYDAADYVQAGTATDRDLYTYENLVTTGGTVKGVVAHGTMGKTASGAKSAKQITRVGGTNYAGDTVALTTTETTYTQAWEENPNTSADWTISEVNGAEFGVEVA